MERGRAKRRVLPRNAPTTLTHMCELFNSEKGKLSFGSKLAAAAVAATLAAPPERKEQQQQQQQQLKRLELKRK